MGSAIDLMTTPRARYFLKLNESLPFLALLLRMRFCC